VTRALITGVAGFAGSHLAEHLLEKGWEVSGIEPPGVSLRNIEKIAQRIRLEQCDVLHPSHIETVLGTLKPDTVFHLAAVAFVPSAEQAPQEAFDANAKGVINLLEGCRKIIPGARIILISSAEVYGKAGTGDLPITEAQPTAPANFYALTKLCAEEAARWYHRVHSINVVILRPFNHIGPRQSPHFVTSSFAQQIAEIESGKRQPVIEVGNLDAARDFTDVRDMVRAYCLAAERCAPGDMYNICSGYAHVIREILEMLLSLSNARIGVRQDPKRLRKSEIPVMIGDYSRFHGATGWKPEHDLNSTLEDILNYWRQLQA